SLAEALDYLEADHDFLLKGDVFTRDFLEMWVSHKRKEHDALRLRPHPYEFFLYYDV
ncbi:MAG TPA: glutamine synthetase, partial [Verrucomicrobiae bacterium]|nr:glutamine synthetase [Verrucomicrobiae bacterium]